MDLCTKNKKYLDKYIYCVIVQQQNEMEYKFRNNRVILLGDTHSTAVTYNIVNGNEIENGSDIFHVGDAGIGFGKYQNIVLETAKNTLERLNKLAQEKNINVYLNRGNHDNPNVWEQCWEFSNVFLVKTGDTGIFPNGKTVLFVGGGISVDRIKRIKDVSYWIMEKTEYLNPVPKTDFVFSHDCPDNFNHPTATLPQSYGWYVERDSTLMDDCKEQRENMRRIWQESGAKRAIYGHFHRSIVEEINGVTAKCLDINELYEFNVEET